MAAAQNDIKTHVTQYNSEEGLIDHHFRAYYQSCDTETQKKLK